MGGYYEDVFAFFPLSLNVFLRGWLPSPFFRFHHVSAVRLVIVTVSVFDLFAQHVVLHPEAEQYVELEDCGIFLKFPQISVGPNGSR